jgi:putative ABC transport system permease protein
VVGVVGDVLHQRLDAPPTLQLYLPHPQWTDTDMLLVVRTSGPPALLAPALRRTATDLDSEVPISALRAMEDVVDASVARRSFAALLIALFAVIAVALAAVGIFGVLSDAVTESREIGIRVAPEPRHGVIALWGAGLVPAGVGIATGALVAWGLGPLSQASSSGSLPRADIYLVVTAMVLGVTVVAPACPHGGRPRSIRRRAALR